MADKVDMSLDDIIKMNKKSKPQIKNGPLGRRNNNQRQQNAVRNNQSRNTRRSMPYSRPAPGRTGGDNKWKHDLFDGNNKPTRLMIENLHFRVSDNDIKELFKEFGVIKKAAVHYDKSGRSLGNAEVLFTNKFSAVKALEKYNDVLLDGRKMKITLVTDKPIVASNNNSRPRKPLSGRLTQSNNNSRPRNNGLNRPKMAGRPQSNRKQAAPTKEQLDAELDAYVSKN